MRDERFIKVFDVGGRFREVWSDCCTLGVVVAIFLIGWLLDSQAMQWLGFVFVLLILLGRGMSKVKRFGAQETADWLRDQYGVTASPKTPATKDNDDG